MSDTPRTDAKQKKWEGTHSIPTDEAEDLYHFARKLERELEVSRRALATCVRQLRGESPHPYVEGESA